MGKIRQEQIDLGSLEIDVIRTEPDPQDISEGALYLADGVEWNPCDLPWYEPYYVVNRNGEWKLWGGGADMPVRKPDEPFPSLEGEWDPGLFDWQKTTRIRNALFDMNKAFYYMAPESPESLDGKEMTHSGLSLHTGRLSAGNENYKEGDEAGQQVNYITIDPNFTLHSPDPNTTFDMAELGEVVAYINDEQVDNFNLSDPYDVEEEDGMQSYPPALGSNEIIEITEVGWYNEFPLWQKGNCDLHIDESLIRKGYNHIQLSREGGVLDQNSEKFDLFYDQGTESPTITVPSVEEDEPVIKHLSGVKFYDRESTFKFNCEAEHVFDNTYHPISPVTYSSSSNTMGSGNIDYDEYSVSGPGDPPHIDDSMTIEDHIATVPNSNVRSMNARLYVQARKPWSNSNQMTSPSENRLIDAVSASSNDMNEYFSDEERRLQPGDYDSIPGEIENVWDSEQELENGNAQVYNGALRYPQIDFSDGYLPEQDVDYSGFSGPQEYYRAIYVGGARSSGTLRLGNLSDSDVQPVGSGNINVEIKLPGETGWLDLGRPFDDGTFDGADGDGCRTGSVSGSDWSWTCGTYTTANSGEMYIVKVTLNNSNTHITEIREID